MVKRWWDSTTTTITLTVVVAMVLGVSLQQLVSSGLPYLGLARQQNVQIANTRIFVQLPGRIADLIEVVDRIPDAVRPIVIAAAQRPPVSIRLLTGPFPNLIDTHEPDANLVRTRVQAVLLAARPVIVADRYRPADPRAGARDGRVENGMWIEAALSDGHWLLFLSNLDVPPTDDPIATTFSRASFATWLTLSMLLAVLLSMLAAQRLIKPLSELAIAVEQLGGSGDAHPLVPRGPREVQGAMHAFNRMQERLRRFNEDRTRMIAAISHDLRMPLTRLQLHANDIEDHDQRQKTLADLYMMNEMIESVLSFAQDDASQEPQCLVDLSALVERICEDASAAGQPVAFSGPRGVKIFCRPTGVRRAISNLVDNAVKYGGNTRVKLVSGTERAVIIVEDEGPGIPWSEREKIFQPFYRIEKSRGRATGGIGLGLSVTRSIVWEHGGEITLSNRKGGGLSVRLELPAGVGPMSSDREEISPTD
jgi:signal transduction histidine kinase